MSWLSRVFTLPGTGGVQATGAASERALDNATRQNDLLTQRQQQMWDQWSQGNQAMQGVDNNMMGWLSNPSGGPAWMQTPGQATAPGTPTFSNSINTPSFNSAVNAPTLGFNGNNPVLPNNSSAMPNTSFVNPVGLQDSTNAALSGTPDWREVQGQAQAAYNRLNNLNLEDTYNQRLADVTRNFGSRGLMMPNSGSTNAAIGLENWRDSQGARLGAEGLLASMQLGQGIRQENVQNQLAREGLLSGFRGEQNQNIQQQYQNEFANRGYGDQMAQQNFGNQMTLQDYNDQIGQQNFGNQMNVQGVNNELAQQNFGNQMNLQGYNDQIAQQDFSNRMNAANYLDTTNRANRAEGAQNYYNLLSYINGQRNNMLNYTNPSANIQNTLGIANAYGGLGNMYGQQGAAAGQGIAALLGAAGRIAGAGAGAGGGG